MEHHLLCANVMKGETGMGAGLEMGGESGDGSGTGDGSKEW